MNFPAPLTHSIDSKSGSLSFGRYRSESESYLWKWLLSFIKQIPVQSERVWLIVERHAYFCNPNMFKNHYDPFQHIPSHHTISILSVLPQCDSAMNVLSIHPSLIALLLNQLSERNHTTVLRFHSYFWICWSECEQRCLNRNESLFVSILSRNDRHITRWTVNVYDYILLVILSI